MADIKNIIFKALDVNSELNTENKKAYEIFEKDEVRYFLIDSSKRDFPRIDDYVKRATSNLKNSNVEVDINTFIEVYGTLSDEEIKNLIMVLVVAFRFNQKLPFTMKTTKEEGYTLRYLISETYGDYISEAINISDSQYFCRSLQDKPSNMIYPETFVEDVRIMFADVIDKVKITVLNKKDLIDEKMNLLLGVNAGSIREPRLMCIEYLNNPSSNEKFAYVGKGITFDSGGMNIKTAGYMRWMKFDMSGAAIVMSTLYSLVKNNVKTNVVAIAALTENLVSPTALRPDDVVVSHSGKTVEIDNTDAEGRLVLADALSYAVKKFNATKLIDVATLTGAMVFSLGDVYSGVWTTNENDWTTFNTVAHQSGEYVWRLPMHENFRKMLDSRIADIVNSCDDRRAGSSRAACFLAEFTHGVDYIHLDVAATADAKNMGQGVMIKTLYNFAKTQK